MAALMSGSWRISGGTWFKLRGVLLVVDTGSHQPLSFQVF